MSPQVWEKAATRLVKAVWDDRDGVGDAVMVDEGAEVGDGVAVTVLKVVGVGVETVIVEDGTEVGDALAVAVLEVVGVGVEVVDGDGVALEVLDAV